MDDRTEGEGPADAGEPDAPPEQQRLNVSFSVNWRRRISISDAIPAGHHLTIQAAASSMLRTLADRIDAGELDAALDGRGPPVHIDETGIRTLA